MRRRAPGYTLVEIVLVILLLGMLAGAAAMAINHGARASLESTTRTDTLSKLRLAVERFAREVRQVRRNPGAPTNYDFITRTANNLSFRRLANDGTTVLTVNLSIAVPQITLGYNNPPGNPLLVNQVSAASFSYLQADGVSPATSNANVAFVEFALTLNDNFGNSYAERVRVSLRNKQ